MDYDSILSASDRAAKITIVRQRCGAFNAYVQGLYVGQEDGFVAALNTARKAALGIK